MCLTRAINDMFAGLLNATFFNFPRLTDVFAIVLTLILFFWSTAASTQSALIELEKPLEHEQKQELADHALHILGGNANVIARWSGGIRVALVSEPSSAISDHLKKTIQDIGLLTELDSKVFDTTMITPQDYVELSKRGGQYDFSICEADNTDECANLVVLISDVETVREVATSIPLRDVYQRATEEGKNPYCFFAPFVTGSMQISQAFVYIREGLEDDMKRTCVQEELFQAFGLFNDATDSKWFSFNNKVEPKEITEFDRLLLKTVYSNEFRPGFPAFAVVRKFLQELDKQ